MIQKESVVRVMDNSGAKMARCIDVYGKKVAKVGDIIRVSIVSSITSPNCAAKKGKVFKAIIVRTRSPLVRANRSVISFKENAVVLLNEKKEVIGNSVNGVVPREISPNIRSLASGVC